jgi:hypothetical protein
LKYRLRSLIAQCKKVNDKTVYVPDNAGIRYDSLVIDISHDLARVTKGDACDEPIIFDELRIVTVTSSQDYTADLPKGSNLSGIMEATFGLGGRPENFESILSDKKVGFGNEYYTFLVPPSEDKFHNITITYILNDRRNFSRTIENLLIRK